MMGLGEHLYRCLLLLYPRRMRDRFGPEMLQMFRELSAAERARGRWRGWRFVVRACLDVPVSAWRSRRQWRDQPGPPLSRVLVTGWTADLQQAARGLRRAPGFAGAAVVTLALGIGSASAIFGIADAVLLDPLPYPEADRLAFLWRNSADGESEQARLGGGDLADVRNLREQFVGVGGLWAMSTNVSDDDRPEQITMGWVTSDLFDILGAAPYRGRLFREDDVIYRDLDLLTDPSYSPPPVPLVLSHGLFLRRYGADPDVIGRVIRVNGQSLLVIGVLAPGFRLLLPPESEVPPVIDAWTLFPTDPLRGDRGEGQLTTVGRLQPEVSWAGAREALSGLSAEWRGAYQQHAQLGTEIQLVPMQAAVVGHFQPTVVLLGGAVAFVLLIACANVASLLLVRSLRRRRELAIRSAIGGGRGRLVRYLLHEVGLITVIGAVVGLALAALGVDLVRALGADAIPRVESIRLDGRVYGFAVLISVGVAVLFGAWPVWRASSTNALETLGARSPTGSRSERRGRAALVTLEVALSVVLLVGAGLMVRTLVNLQRVELGFDPEGVTTANVSLPFFSYRDGGDRLRFFQSLLMAVREAPGVESAGAITQVPLAEGDGQDWTGPFALRDGDDEAWERNEVVYAPVMPGYFETMRSIIVTGRSFESADNQEGARLVVVVDDVCADRLWPDGNAVGQRLLVSVLNPAGTGGERAWAEVVGVVERARHAALGRESTGTIYFPFQTYRWFQMTLVVRTSQPVASTAVLVRQEVSKLDADLPVFAIRPMNDYVTSALAPTRFVLIVLGAFAAAALLLAMVGLYGVVAYAARSRVPEIGIRLAFGASRAGVLRSVFIQGMVPAALGTAVGVAGAVGLGRMLDHVLFGVPPVDATTYSAIAAVILAVSSAAAYLPARSAAGVDPVVALRAE